MKSCFALLMGCTVNGVEIERAISYTDNCYFRGIFKKEKNF